MTMSSDRLVFKDSTASDRPFPPVTLEDQPVMTMEVEVNLDFACWCCMHDVGVTLRCAGKGLASGKGLATVRISCPTCGNINQLYFEPITGALHQVAPYWDTCPVPEPSLN